MNKQQLTAIITERISHLESIRKSIEDSRANREAGCLFWKRVKGKTRYFIRKNPGDTNGTYLSRRDAERISLLAEKYRNKKYLSAIRKECAVLGRCLRILSDPTVGSDIENVWDNLPREVRALVSPPPLTDEDYARKWQAERRRRSTKTIETPFKTLRGEYVRSKSETIIADRLFAAGIPYHYEISLDLVDWDDSTYTVHPDFAVLNKRTRQVFIWEHLGRLGDDDYCEDNLAKINSYVKTGYVPGKNLLLSFESHLCPLNALYVDTLIKEYLL